MSAMAVVEYDQNVTPDTIYGSGNTNGSFTTDRADGIELGLRATVPFVGAHNSNGDGSYSFSLAEIVALGWNFEFTINTDFDTSSGLFPDDLTYELGMDGDPGLGTDFLTFDPIFVAPLLDHSFGDNSTANDAGAEAGDAGTYTTYLATLNVVQQSWNFAFFPFPPLDTYVHTVPGTYSVYLLAKLGGIEVARVEIQVLVGGAPPAVQPAVDPIGYDMINGGRGNFSYLDKAYAGGSGDPTQCRSTLADGLGILVDGVVPPQTTAGNWDDTAGVPYVGWPNSNDGGCAAYGGAGNTPDPEITFNFASPTAFQSVTVWLDNSPNATVRLPASVDVTVGANATRNFPIPSSGVFAPQSFTLPTGGDVGDTVLVKLNHDVKWIMLSEVDFTGEILKIANDDTATFTEDDPATTIDVLANDFGAPILIDSVDDTSTNGTVLITNGGLDLTYEPPANYCNDGTPTDDFKYTLTPGGSEATVAVTVTCANDLAVIDYVVDTTVPTGSQTADYSDIIDVVTISATDVDNVGAELTLDTVAAIPSALVIGSKNCSDVDNDPSVKDGTSCTWTMTGTIADAAIIANIVFRVHDGTGYNDCSGDPTVCDYDLTIQAEEAGVEYDAANPIDLAVEVDGDPSGAFSLLFTAWEIDDPDNANDGTARAGNLNKMVAYMDLVPVGPGGKESGVCVLTNTPTNTEPPPSPGNYSEEATFECFFDEVPVNTYEVDVGVNGGYYTGSDEGVFVVYDPSLGFTTGGGFFYWPDTCEEIEDGVCDPDGYLGDKTNFGFNFKYNRKRTNVQGNLLMIRHSPEGSWKVKSNAIDGLGLGDEEDSGGTYGWVAVSGKATFRDPTDYNSGGNAFLLYVEDHGEQGCNQEPIDEIWIEVDAENVWSDPLGPDPAVDEPDVGDATDAGDDVPIFCGNIVVPHNAGGNGKGKPPKD
jgi:hypothetical protein